MSNYGWIKLPRNIAEHPAWATQEVYSLRCAWIDLMLMASYQTHTFIHEMKSITVQKGEIITSQKKLAAKWGWSISKVGRFLSALKDAGEIEYAALSSMTRITLCNWKTYQDGVVAGGIFHEKQTRIKREAVVKRAGTYNKDKKEENEKKRTEVNLEFVKAKKGWEELTPEEKSLAAECKAKYQNIFKSEIDKNKLCILVYGAEEDTEEHGFGDWEVLRETLKYLSSEPLARKVIMPHYYVWGYSRNREFVERMKKKLEKKEG